MTDATAQLPAAGWYPDPSDSAGRRWWDGAAWTNHVVAAPPVTPVRAPEHPWDSGFVASRPAVAAVEPAPYRPFADRDARDPLIVEPSTPAWRRDRTANPAATRAAIAALLVTVFVGASLVLHLPVGVPIVAIGVAIVFGILGIVKSRETLSGLKRSITALVVELVALVITGLSFLGSVAWATYDVTAEYEASLVDLYNSIDPTIAAVSAECSHVDVPQDGDLIPCTIALADGRQQPVILTITSDRGAYIADIPQ